MARVVDEAARAQKVGKTRDLFTARFILRYGAMLPEVYGRHHTEIAWDFSPSTLFHLEQSNESFLKEAHVLSRVRAHVKPMSKDQLHQWAIFVNKGVAAIQNSSILKHTPLSGVISPSGAYMIQD